MTRAPQISDSTPLAAPVRQPLAPEVDRCEAVRQYSLARIFALWAAAGVPMWALAWVVAPWLGDQLGGREPLGKGLLICLNAGLIWIAVLTFIVIRRKQGSLEWPRVRDSLWLRPAEDPKTRHVGGKVWWWLLVRALLLPRMRAVFGRRVWVANGALFALSHLHMPWVIPASFVEGVFLEAYPSRRFHTAWMGSSCTGPRASSSSGSCSGRKAGSS